MAEIVDLLPVSNDYVFAQLFRRKNHERVLVCLLNAILDGHPHIKSITLDPTEHKKKRKDGKTNAWISLQHPMMVRV